MWKLGIFSLLFIIMSSSESEYSTSLGSQTSLSSFEDAFDECNFTESTDAPVGIDELEPLATNEEQQEYLEQVAQEDEQERQLKMRLTGDVDVKSW